MFRKMDSFVCKTERWIKNKWAERNKHPLSSMIFFYSVIWIVLCLVLTVETYRSYMENAMRDWKSDWSASLQNAMREFEREASQPDFLCKDRTDQIAIQLKKLEELFGRDYGWPKSQPLNYPEQPYGLFQAKALNAPVVVDLKSFQVEGMCRLLSSTELLKKGAEHYGSRFSTIYIGRLMDPLKSEDLDGEKLNVDLLASRQGNVGDFASILRGDIYVNYYNVIPNSYSGEKIQIIVSCVIPGALSESGTSYLVRMLWVYLGIFLFFAAIIWVNYKRVHSAQAKSIFYRSLVNSMAHDLKSPLMVMQGYCENLKENVHTEKKDYYADQVLSNIQYLSTLMDRNLYHSRKREDLAEVTTPGTPPIYLTELVNAAIERNQDRLQEKNIHVIINGETSLAGDRETLSLVVENIIGNAAKYTPENGTIEITGTDYAFFVSNTAELSYGKNLQQLLNPLEMGDESRTAGSGTGLGLAIANGIIQGYGGKIKLSYDKKLKRFTCCVKLGRARWT